ncbi:MAG: trypsin-like peptidase domain-containing protein [Halioglobus sp.]
MPINATTKQSPTLILALSIALLLLANPSPAAGDSANTPDSRQVYSGKSPDWLQAVGKLQVPGIKMENGRRTQHFEDCSATLISRAPDTQADIIVTAWHCLEYYGDLSKAISFTLKPAQGEVIYSEAYRLVDGGGMHADWAILRLYTPISADKINFLQVNPGIPDTERQIAMAGFSRDAGKGEHGTQLTYDPACTITAQTGQSSVSNCRAYKGASGGAVVQLSEQGLAWFSGVISAGDGNGVSTFVPISDFRLAVSRYLQ